MWIRPTSQTIWKMQIAVLWLLAAFVAWSPAPKADPRWFGVLAASVGVGIWQWFAYHWQCLDLDLKRIDVKHWAIERKFNEDAKKEADESHANWRRAADAQHDLTLRQLDVLRQEYADLEHRRVEWKREMNRHARLGGAVLPFPSVEDASAQPVTKN